MRFKHGKYTFSISTEHITSKSLQEQVQKAIWHQFKSFLPSDEKSEKIKFYLCENVEAFFPWRKYLNIGSVKYKDSTLFYNQYGIKFVSHRKDEQLCIYFEISTKSTIRSNCRLLNKTFSNALESQISLFYYRIFIIFTQLANIEMNTTYIHGATVSDNSNNAILFPADSGVGKSSMLFRMAKENRYYYIADDLSIISDNGESYYTGRAISTKPYHLKNFPFINQLIEDDMSYLQKLQWKIVNDNRLVFGVDPQKLFASKIKKKAKVKKIIHLINTNSNEFILKKLDAHSLALASANILMNELILGNQLIYKALSIPGNDMFESPGNFYLKSLNIYETLFKQSETYMLEVPYMSHPDKMYDFLIKNKLID